MVKLNSLVLQRSPIHSTVSMVVAKMLHSYIFLILDLFYFITSFSIITTHARYDFPRDRELPCVGCDRNTPMSLISSQAKPVSVPRLKINISKNATLTTTNTGNAVQDVLVEGSITITGGPVFDTIYNLFQSRYHADGVSQFTRAIGLRDGVGGPVCHELQFIKRGVTTAEAFSSPDGFVLIVICINVEGEINNPKFDKYAPVLEAVRAYNSSTNSSAHDLYDWFLETLPNNCYFSFPGSRSNPATSGHSPIAIWIYPSSKVRPTISYCQFQKYLKVLNQVGQPLVSAQPCYEQGKRPVVQICDPVIVHYEKH